MNHSDIQSGKVPAAPAGSFRSTREIVESLVVALALAFFFKAFAAEAFVIPTGSMATTLMGRHKDVNCERCGFPFQISASEESNDGMERFRNALPKVVAGTCPQCRYTMYVGQDNADKKNFLTFSGDRIFVNKSQFDFHEPQRWHVTVFRYPGKPQVNYIKRLVGLENESILISNGDIFVKKNHGQNSHTEDSANPAAAEFQIQRKPLNALLSMLRPVDDNDYVNPVIHQLGVPRRWVGTNWKQSDDLKSFETDGKGRARLTYRNIVLSTDDWHLLSTGQAPAGIRDKQPQLITDFVGYNSGVLNYGGRYNTGQQIAVRDVNNRKEHFVAQNPQGFGLNWVGDLAVSCCLTVQKAQGTFTLMLVKGGNTFSCRIDLATGAAFFEGGAETGGFSTSLKTALNKAGTYDIMFCNVDEELILIVNGAEQRVPYETVLPSPDKVYPRDRSPNQLDLTPASFIAENAAVKIEHLKVQRDLYYIACNENSDDSQCDLRYSPFRGEYSLTEKTASAILSSPERWTNFGKTNVVRFDLKKDEFLMLGDNSAKSKDSRLWTMDGIPCYVPRRLLIGEAMFVYWPHGLRIPGTNIALIPNPGKMRLID